MPLRLLSLAEFIDRSQIAQRGIEERQQVGQEDVVEKQFTIAVGLFAAQLLDVTLQLADQFAPLDLLGQ